MNKEMTKEQTEESIHKYINMMVDMIHEKKMETLSYILKNYLGFDENNSDVGELGSRITRIEYDEKPHYEYYFLDYDTPKEEFLMEWHTKFDNTGGIDQLAQPVTPSFEINAPIKLDELF